MKLEVKPYTLKFSFDARTSRGAMTERKVWFLKLTIGNTSGQGEVAPIPRLSPEDVNLVPGKLEELTAEVARATDLESLEDLLHDLDGFPSIRFGLEMCILDLKNGGKGMWFDNLFSQGRSTIPINGLIWMGEKEWMIEQIDKKLDEGFDCIKIKVGSLDFESELEVLAYIRSKSREVTIRLDANGAFATNEVLAKLNKLADFDIHSIEQPIAPKQEQAMKLVVEKSPIPIAFDEELIGIRTINERQALLDFLKPHFLVLKPTLLGGFSETSEWIQLANERGIGWWVTSYLESNLGLNAIAQFTASMDDDMKIPHGLGTGGLFENNLPKDLRIENGKLM